jgi:hypothetical protein
MTLCCYAVQLGKLIQLSANGGQTSLKPIPRDKTSLWLASKMNPAMVQALPKDGVVESQKQDYPHRVQQAKQT